MPNLETVEELADAIADMLGIYCDHEDPENHDEAVGGLSRGLLPRDA